MNYSLRKLQNVYMYSHVHIAFCTICLYLFTMRSTGANANLTYGGLLFMGSVFLYSLHRLIGINYFYTDVTTYRFQFYRQHKGLLYIALFISGLVGGWCFILLNSYVQLPLMLAIIFGVMYALPIYKGKRLRDIHYIKIFVIALVWSYLTVYIPLLNRPGTFIFPLFLERFFFFLAITIPFDVRDMQVDKDFGVRTLPITLGLDNSLKLALGFLLLGFIAQCYGYFSDILDVYTLWTIIITYIIAAIFIWKSRNKVSDTYFTGWIDGLMILPIIFYEVLSRLFSSIISS